MDIQSIIQITLDQFPILTVFLSTLIFGEEVVIILGFFSGIGFISLWILMVFGFFGTLLSDLLWFAIGKYFFSEKKGKKPLHSNYHKFMEKLDKKFKGNNFFILFVSRFFFIIRIFALIHIGMKGMKIKRFLMYETPIILIWLGIFISIGWYFGKSALKYFNIFSDFQLILVGIIALIMLFLLIKEIVKIYINKK